MKKSESNQSANEQPGKKRSLKERLIVWGGIAIFIPIVLLEWQSREYYEASYKNLENAINLRDENGRFQGVPITEVDKLVKGFAFRADRIDEDKTSPIRGEAVITKKRRLTFQWPSLFRHYEFRLTVGKKEDIIQIEPVIPGAKK